MLNGPVGFSLQESSFANPVPLLKVDLGESAFGLGWTKLESSFGNFGSLSANVNYANQQVLFVNFAEIADKVITTYSA